MEKRVKRIARTSIALWLLGFIIILGAVGGLEVELIGFGKFTALSLLGLATVGGSTFALTVIEPYL